MKHTTGKIFTCERSRLESLIKESTTYSDVLRKLGLLPIGSNRYNLKEKIKYENIDDSHLASNSGFGWSSGKILITKEHALSYCISNSSMDTTSIKRYILQFNLIEYKCDGCGLKNEWNNKLLTLDLHHKNGIRDDHRIENLEFLCPNCHSQEYTSNRKTQSVMRSITVEMVKSVISICHSKNQIFKNLKVASSRGNYIILNKILKEHNLKVK